jgi:hypothetical protein
MWLKIISVLAFSVAIKRRKSLRRQNNKNFFFFLTLDYTWLFFEFIDDDKKANP